MIRYTIEYIRKQNKLSIDDLVVDVCSAGMYYKYLKNEKNFSEKNLIKIKDRLGADDLLEEEILEYKEELNQIIHKFMRFYTSYEEIEKDVNQITELETQLMLCDETVIDYLIIKMFYLQCSNRDDEIPDCLFLLSKMEDRMNEFQMIHYLSRKINNGLLSNKEKEFYLGEISKKLDRSINNKDYGIFYSSCGVQYIYLHMRMSAIHHFEKAKVLYSRDMNFVGLVKVTNIQAGMFIEQDKYAEALALLLSNLETTKRVASITEMYLSIGQIIVCYSFIDHELCEFFSNMLFNEITHDTNIQAINKIIYNIGIGLLICYDYRGYQSQLQQLISIIKDKNIKCDNVLKLLITMYETKDEYTQVILIEKEILPLLTNNISFNYCSWLMDKVTNYYEERRMYKKANELKDALMREYKRNFLY